MADLEAASKQTATIAIFGSCVSRDALETMDRSQYPITTYLSRQSLLTAGTDASANLPATWNASSNFQRRNVDRDISGKQLVTLVEAGEPDVLLWDLVDERHGVWQFEDGSMLTRSIDVMNIPELHEATTSARLIPFGSDEHFLRWSGAASSFVDALEVIGWRDRVLVVAADWAEVDTAGEATPWSMGVRAADANKLFARYYDRLEELGLPVLRIQQTIADPKHRWGLAPFHYVPEVYEQIHRGIIELVGKDEK